MKRTLAALLVSSIAVVALAGSNASAGRADIKHCRNTHFAPR